MITNRLKTTGICAAFFVAVGGCSGIDAGGQANDSLGDGVDPGVGQTSEALTKARGSAGDLVADVEVGRRDFTEIMPREIVPDKLNNPGGVVVDKTVSPGRAYIWDSGNSRILGLDLATCYATSQGTRCTPQLVFGQTSGSDRGGCNQDSSAQQYPQRPVSSASTLCGVPETTHTVLEDKSFANMFVDASANLWVPDVLNNRVLKYNTPFTTDTVADLVFGQPNFTANGCNGATAWTSIPNPTASTLCFWDPNNVGSGAGVRLDSAGNLWVADGGNNRVLRFKNTSGVIATTADVVLGQTSFTTRGAGTALNQLSSPNAVMFDGSGKLYVVDSGNHRVLVYPAGVTTGASATSTLGSFPSDQFGPFAVELDPQGRGFWTTRFDNIPNVQNAAVAQLWSFSGQLVAGVPTVNIAYNSGGSIAFDAQNRLLVTDYVWGQDLLRYVAQPDGSYQNDRQFFTPPVLYNMTTARRLEAPAWVGVAVADKVSNPPQLIVADGRLNFWNNPTAIANGQDPTGCVGDCLNVYSPFNQIPVYEQIKTDASDRVWAEKQIQLDVFQAPLSSTSTPIKTLSSFNVLGGGTITLDNSNMAHGVAPTPDGQYVWVSQPDLHRVFRVRGPLGASPVVDVILGQTSLGGAGCNRGAGQGASVLNSLCFPGAISIDRQGNLFVSDHYLEFEGNFRLLMFAASTFPATPSSVIFAPNATKEFPANNPSLNYQMGTFEPAFDSSNHMVVGLNPYAALNLGIAPIFSASRFVQYFNSPTSFNASNPSDPAFAVPSGHLEDFYGWAVGMTFDSSNNLYAYDANRGRVNIYKTPFATAPRKVGDTIESEAYASQQGTQLDNNNTTVGFFDAGDFLCYGNIDMTGVTGLAITMASANSGGVFSVRLDSATGTQLGTFTVQSTGGWTTWQIKNMSLAASSGVHTLCFKGETGSGICNLDKFQLTGSSARYRAGDTVESEAYTAQVGTQLENNGTTVGFFDAGDSLCYDGVDMTGVTGLDMTIASANSGGVFSIRTDSPTGTQIGSFTVQSTGGWTTWQQKVMTLTAVSGIHTLCFKGESGGGICNLDRFVLSNARYHRGDNVQSEAFTSQSGTQLENNGTTVGFFDAGDYLCYDSVDMTQVSSLLVTLASANSGGVFSVRVDGPTGTQIASYTVQSTGGWTTWQQKSIGVSSVSGAHTLCLKAESGGGVCNFDVFQLN